MNKNDLLNRVEHERHIDRDKIKVFKGRKFTVAAKRGDDVFSFGEFDEIRYSSTYAQQFSIISNTELIVTPDEVARKNIWIDLNLNNNYSFRMVDNPDEVIELEDLIKTEDKYIFKTDVLETGDFIRLKYILPHIAYNGTAVVTTVEEYKIELMLFGLEQRHQYIDIWARDIYTGDNDFEFEILNKHEYVAKNLHDWYAFDSDTISESDVITALDVLEED